MLTETNLPASAGDVREAGSVLDWAVAPEEVVFPLQDSHLEGPAGGEAGRATVHEGHREPEA